MATIPELLDALAVELEEQMVQIGGDPRDATEVEAFVNGCAISKKLKKIITERLDQE